jgi:hypothetical protein
VQLKVQNLGVIRTPTLFKRLSRYLPGPGRDAVEDRLTEGLAATLEAAPEACRHLVQEWFGVTPDGSLSVTTQHRASPGERVDLQLAFGRVGGPALRVWVEAKVGATPYREQAERYLDLLEERSKFTWLLPVGVEVVGGSPARAPVHTWQELGTVLNDWLSGTAVDENGSYGFRLVEQFVRHLEEERLAAVNPFDEHDVSAINGYRIAVARIREVVRQANTIIEASRGPVYRKDSRGALDFWEHAPRGPGWIDTAYFELYGRRDDARDAPAGEWVFGVGVSWPRPLAPAERAAEEWFSRRWAEGFEYGDSGATRYLFRYLSPQELAETPTLHGQAARLAAWALETWALLDNDPSPIS